MKMKTNFILLMSLLTPQTVVLSSSSQVRLLYPEVSGELDSELADMLYSKGYLPNELNLPKPSPLQTNDNEMYLLSKLNDQDLIKLLKDQSKPKEFGLKDIIKVVLQGNADKNHIFFSQDYRESNYSKSPKQTTHSEKSNLVSDMNKYPAYFRLEDRQVEPHLQNNEADFIALKKLNSLLYRLPQKELKQEDLYLDDERKELLFDILVAQLKALCCKKSSKREELLLAKTFYKPYINKQKSYLAKSKAISGKNQNQKPSEFMFLIINDEIEGKGSDELILVDPESLQQNSSVLLLGPIKTPLSDGQLSSLMNRVSDELSKPEYNTLLQQLSDGTLSKNNESLLKKFIYGPESRRYMKPHRCNHQSKLAKVYGGPKWLICTGYLNLNTPSLYD